MDGMLLLGGFMLLHVNLTVDSYDVIVVFQLKNFLQKLNSQIPKTIRWPTTATAKSIVHGKISISKATTKSILTA